MFLERHIEAWKEVFCAAFHAEQFEADGNG